MDSEEKSAKLQLPSVYYTSNTCLEETIKKQTNKQTETPKVYSFKKTVFICSRRTFKFFFLSLFFKPVTSLNNFLFRTVFRMSRFERDRLYFSNQLLELWSGGVGLYRPEAVTAYIRSYFFPHREEAELHLVTVLSLDCDCIVQQVQKSP